MPVDVGAKKRAGIVLMILGLVLFALSFLPAAAGAKIPGIILGILVAAVGFVMSRKQGHRTEPPA